MRNTYAVTQWAIEDVIEEALQLNLYLTDNEAHTFLQAHESDIEEAMLQAGWHTIGEYLREEYKV